MRSIILLALLLLSLSLFADDSLSLSLRGKTQILARLGTGARVANSAVIFLPGDGGWRGSAVSFGKSIASWGYEVYAFDTKKYLEEFSQDGARLSQDQLAKDVRRLAEQVSSVTNKPVILVGWSQGAGMAVAASSGSQVQSSIQGVLTLGLPEKAVLGWDWKATLAILTRRDPDQPVFLVKPLLRSIAPTPIWMIHGSDDEFTTTQSGRDLFQAASEPKHLQEIVGANHRFDGHLDELYRSLKEGLAWIVTR